jgi:hypothetical protein
MTDDLLAALLPAIGIAAFERDSGGSFKSVAPVPSWFEGLAADGTFPFLGHVLEEATAFWNSNTDGFREWGPSAAVDASGREFHFMVTAIAHGRKQFLLCRLDTGSDQVRDVLQQVRQRALDADHVARRQAKEVARAAGEVHRLLGRLLMSGPTAEQLETMRQLAVGCEELARLSNAAPE